MKYYKKTVSKICFGCPVKFMDFDLCLFCIQGAIYITDTFKLLLTNSSFKNSNCISKPFTHTIILRNTCIVRFRSVPSETNFKKKYRFT